MGSKKEESVKVTDIVIDFHHNVGSILCFFFTDLVDKAQLLDKAQLPPVLLLSLLSCTPVRDV